MTRHNENHSQLVSHQNLAFSASFSPRDKNPGTWYMVAWELDWQTPTHTFCWFKWFPLKYKQTQLLQLLLAITTRYHWVCCVTHHVSIHITQAVIMLWAPERPHMVKDLGEFTIKWTKTCLVVCSYLGNYPVNLRLNKWLVGLIFLQVYPPTHSPSQADFTLCVCVYEVTC